MKRRLIPLAILCAAMTPAFSLAWQERHFEHLGYFHDDGMYWVAGKSLAEGRGYRILSLPGTPYQTKYPPVLPLMLAFIWKTTPAFPGNLPWAMLLMIAILPVFAWINVRLLESWGSSRSAAILISAWIVLSPYVMLFGTNMMTELLVSAVLGCCFLTAQKAAEKNSGRLAVAAGVLAGLAYLIKTGIVPLLLAGPLWFALRGKRRLAWLFFAPILMSFLAWNVWSLGHAVHSEDAAIAYYTSYTGDFLRDLRFSDCVLFVSKNIPVFLLSVGNLLIPNVPGVPWQRLSGVFAIAIGAFSIVGTVRQAREQGIGLQHWFATGYSALLLVWDYPPNERFLIPILPVFAYGALTEFRHLIRLLRSGWASGKKDQRALSVALTILLTVAALWACAMQTFGHYLLLPAMTSRSRAQFESNRKVYEWIDRNVAPGEPILTNYDAAVFLYTGHRALRLPTLNKEHYREDREAIAHSYAEVPAFARAHGIRYVLLCQEDLDLNPFVKEIVDWKKLTSGAPYRLLIHEQMTELYELESSPDSVQVR